MREGADWRSSRLKRFEAAAIAVAGYRLIALLGATLRWKTEGLEHLQTVVESGRQPILAVWHGRILSATYFFRRRGIVVMTSENFDGEWITGIIERFGYRTARGSTSRGARKALLQLRRDMAAGRAAAFTVDGPRGPARVAQPGAVWLAKASGNPVVPFHLEADRHWTLTSWDRTQIPKPFAKVALAVGRPFDVAPDTAVVQVHAVTESVDSIIERAVRNRPDVAAARALGIEDRFVQEVRVTRAKLAGPQLGPDGRLLEWAEPLTEREPGHRHLSHLYAVYPGWQITPRVTPGLAEAARKSLAFRLSGGGSTRAVNVSDSSNVGWSLAWNAGLWARLGDGPQAHRTLTSLLRRAAFSNLLDKVANFLPSAHGGLPMVAAKAKHSSTDVTAIAHHWSSPRQR